MLFRSGIDDAELRWLYRHAAALVTASHEDFGLTPLEANAFGRPVVALRAGGHLDTVLPDRTGLFVEEAGPPRLRGGDAALPSLRTGTGTCCAGTPRASAGTGSTPGCGRWWPT